MAKAKQPSARADEIIEGDVLEKTVQDKKVRPSGNPKKTSRTVFLITLTSFLLSFFALGFAAFAVWQGSQIAAVEVPKLGVVEKRFSGLEAIISANSISQQKAVVALNRRFDQLSNAALSNDSVDTDETSDNERANRNVTKHTVDKIDQRFSTLERTVKELVAATIEKPTVAISNKPIRENMGRRASPGLSAKPDQASLFIVSGLLADNIVGKPLDRWIELLQRQVDKGVVIPDLDQLRILAKPTPKRPFNLIRDAHDLTPKMAKALNQVTEDAGFIEQVGAKLGQLVRLREIGDGADGNELALQEFEAALAIQDLDGAIRAASQWSGSDVPSLESWIAQAQSRRSLDRAVSALVTERLAAAFALQR